ncbi:hypothetical protein AGMMS50268_37210 [Spirochaetia bacterium]|nr:hypothetical protein AGMMS50268_37210 [Spirochaetia bacterium]
MSTSDPYALNFIGLIKAMGARLQGGAYWIVKLAFHPEMAKYIKAHGGKHGAA